MRDVRCLVALLLAYVLPGCSGPVNAVQCEQNSNCDLGNGGTCTASPTGSQWCAYPDTSCPSGLRYSDQSVGEGLAGECVGEVGGQDAGIDAELDAPLVDAQGELAFTVIYGDQWWITAESYHYGWFLLLANGTVAPDVSTIQVVSVNDTHPVALFRVTANQYSGLVGQGRVAGSTVGDGSARFTAAITETRERTTEQYLTMQVLDAPYGQEYDYQAQVELSVNGIRFTLDLQIHHPSDIVYHEPMVVIRKPIYK